MTDDKPFDEARSAAIKHMLMVGVSRSTDPRATARRRAGLIAALVATALVLAGGSAALAFNAGAIFHPAEVVPTSPTPSPGTPRPNPTSPTPSPGTPRPDSTRPASTIPLSCQDLTAAGALTLSSPSLSSNSGPTGAFNTLAEASRVQAGELTCQWNDADAPRFVVLSALADAQGGRAAVAAALADGWTPLGIGDASAWSCERVTLGCSARIVDGAYWLELSTEARGLTVASGTAALSSTARALVAQLRTHPVADPAWVAPTTVWTGLDCSAWAAAPVPAILGTPGVAGPQPIRYGAASRLDDVGGIIGCWWAVPDQAQTAPDQHRSVDVELVPGSGWAWDQRELWSADAEPMTVRGADKAELICMTSEGRELCMLDVLADGSWMRVSSADTAIPGDRVRLVSIAEAILALR